MKFAEGDKVLLARTICGGWEGEVPVFHRLTEMTVCKLSPNTSDHDYDKYWVEPIDKSLTTKVITGCWVYEGEIDFAQAFLAVKFPSPHGDHIEKRRANEEGLVYNDYWWWSIEKETDGDYYIPTRVKRG